MKVLIVDDHPIVLSGFKALLDHNSSEPAMEVVDAQSAVEAEQVLATEAVDVCVVDINLPGISGFSLARKILAVNPAARIIMFSMNDEPMSVAQAMDVGAHGFVSKNDNPRRMLEAIEAVAAGQSAWPAGIAERIAHLDASQSAPPLLTPREHDVLRLLATGKSLSEIGEAVSVSYKTAAMTCAGLRTKLSARTQAELVAIAVERKLV